MGCWEEVKLDQKRNMELRKPAPLVGRRVDYSIAVIVLALIAIGLVMVYSTGWVSILKQTGGASDRNSLFYNQLVSFGLGLVVWYACTKIPLSWLRRAAPYVFYISLALMFLVLVPKIGVNINGASRWVRIGFLNFQPVEFFKLGFVLYLAHWLQKNNSKLNVKSWLEGLLPFLILLFVSAGLVTVIQRDMGSAMVIAMIGFGMYWMSGVQIRLFVIALGAALGSAVAMILLFPYRLSRVLTFLNHSDDPSGASYHINQALIALGSGGLFGRGIGKSLQAYGYLPEATNDSVFAIIGEEFGILGCSVVIGLVGLLVYRGFRIVANTQDEFARLVAAGITIWIGAQATINIAAMLGIIPLTGITLPFISYGGTSLLALLAAVGILQNISRYSTKETRHANRPFGRRQRRTHHTATGRA